jgi:hypothetical protein
MQNRELDERCIGRLGIRAYIQVILVTTRIDDKTNLSGRSVSLLIELLDPKLITYHGHDHSKQP